MNELQQTDSMDLSALESGLYPPPKDPESYCKRSSRGLFEWLELFVWVIGITLLIFSVFLRVAVVDGDSMRPTLKNGDTLLLSDLGYTPQKGDIIVFQIAGSDHSHPVVKRVIATEGDRVNIDFDTWTVTVNDTPLPEDYVTKEDSSMERGNISLPLTVPQGCVFVLGDNRNASWDSRYSAVGCVDTRAILGKVIFRFSAHQSK